MIMLAAILAFAQSKPADEEYRYTNGEVCPVAQMLRAEGKSNISVSPGSAAFVLNGEYEVVEFETLGEMDGSVIDIDDILIGNDEGNAICFDWDEPACTFGALVSRIKQYQSAVA